MTLKQSRLTETAEPQAHYSPEEASEILRLAASIQGNTITAEQLRAIAYEAGISEESLALALQQCQQRRVAEAQKQQQRAQRKRRLTVLVSALALMGVLLLAFVGTLATSWRVATKTLQGASRYVQVLDSSEGCVVERMLDDNDILVRRADGRTVVIPHFQSVVFASISPSGKHVALYDSLTDEVWVANIDDGTFKKVAPINQQASPTGALHKEFFGNPFIGWLPAEGKDVARVRQRDGRIVEIEFPFNRR